MPQPEEISPQDLKSLLDSSAEVTLVDCREPFEHEIVALSGARLIPLGTIPQHAASLAEAPGRLVVYCHHGMRSLQATHWLRENGFPEAQSLRGGVDAWAEEVDPSLPRY